MEAAVRWSPHSTGDRQRFLLIDIADSTLTLNEINRFERKSLTYSPVAKCSKLPNFSAFAWSPVQEAIVALGLASGNTSLFRLGGDHSQRSEPLATFKVKQQRKCNSVAFSTQNWLAVALDKIRSDVCLNIYDASNQSASPQEPVRRLCAAELVSSVRFFSNQPQELVASTQRAFIRIYDLRGMDATSPGVCASKLTVLLDGTFGAGGSLQASTRDVNNIAIDPLDENYFASAGSTNAPSVSVWDKRWIAQSTSSGSSDDAVFRFSPAVDGPINATVWSLRYSGLRRGRLAICSNAGELKVIDMLEGRTTSFPDSEYLPANSFGGNAWQSNRYVSQTRSVVKPFHDGSTPEGESRLMAFDWTSNSLENAGQAALALRASRGVDVLRVSALNPHIEITGRQDLSVGLEKVSLVEQTPYVSNANPVAPYENRRGTGTAEDFGPLDYDPEASFTEDAEGAIVRCDLTSPRIGRILASSSAQRERCRRGYLLDCHKNIEIVAGDWQLERLWEIVNRFREQAANDNMVYKSWDLSYVGVSGIWSERPGNESKRRVSSLPLKADEAIAGLINTKDIPAFEGERTVFPENRQLCLAVCGWKFTPETLEAECQELIDRGLYYQAIVQAVLHDYRHIALNLLRMLIRSKTIPNIGLGALLAADNVNEEQQEMCSWMAVDTDDPALKALLTFLTTGNWRDVMKTNYLHLGYRVALGLKYLNDTELSGFIQTETARAVKNGDLEGILLTGLTEQAMDLFQTYIVRTNDLQTAVLATAFTNPLYVDDVRWEMWKETYFTQMQSWRAFNERAKFNVQHSRLARAKNGHSLVEPPPNQVTLRCIHCNGSLGMRDKTDNSQKTTKVMGPAAHAGTVHQACGRHMPRCTICMLWLGTPDPARREGAKELAKLEDKMAKFLTFCVNCGHGFHADHAKAWFEKHRMCPEPSCRCMCSLE